MSKVSINFRADDPEAEELWQRANRANLTLTDFILSELTKSGAWRANRVRSGPITASTVAAEEAEKLRWWAGDPASSQCWSAVDHVLEAMGVTNIDHRAELLAEMALRRPDVVAAAYALHLAGHDPALLVRAAFEEWFTEEPEARYDAFSIEDTARLMMAESIGYEASLRENSSRADFIAYHYAEAERCTAAARRAHSRRILKAWREANVAWPPIEIGRDGGPRLQDGVHLTFVTEHGRRAPRLVSGPKTEAPAVNSVEPEPRANQIGAPLERLQTLARHSLQSAPIGGDKRS